MGQRTRIVAWIVSGMASLVVTTAFAQDDDTASAAPTAATEAEPAVSGEALDSASRGRASDDTDAMDELDLRRTEITGNQELPKVLYIVPWQKSDPGNLLGRPVNTLLDEVLAPLDREEFIRQVDYYSDLEDGKEAL